MRLHLSTFDARLSVGLKAVVYKPSFRVHVQCNLGYKSLNPTLSFHVAILLHQNNFVLCFFPCIHLHLCSHVSGCHMRSWSLDSCWSVCILYMSRWTAISARMYLVTYPGQEVLIIDVTVDYMYMYKFIQSMHHNVISNSGVCLWVSQVGVLWPTLI